jgi:hypothetical protein
LRASTLGKEEDDDWDDQIDHRRRGRSENENKERIR